MIGSEALVAKVVINSRCNIVIFNGNKFIVDFFDEVNVVVSINVEVVDIVESPQYQLDN